MKPVTTPHPMASAARAVAIISSTAHFRRASGVAAGAGRGERHQPFVVPVADALPGQVRTERPALEVVLLEDGAPPGDVGRVGRRPLDVHVVAPTRDFESVVAPPGNLADTALRTAGRPTGR